MKKLTWKKAKGGRSMEHQLEGFFDGELAFIIEGGLCVTDLREMKASSEWVAPKHYRLRTDGDRREEAKHIAYELLNGINLEEHQANWQAGKDEEEKTARVLKNAEEFLEKLKNGELLNEIKKEKKYSEEDLRAAWEDGYQYSVHRSEGIKNEKYEEFISNFKIKKDEV